MQLANERIMTFHKENEEREAFLKLLLENVDANGNSIISNPNLPAPLSIDIPPSSSFYSMSFFSFSTAFRDSINKGLDLPKWNEITFFTALQEGMAQRLSKDSGVKLIRARQLFKELADNKDGWQDTLTSEIQNKIQEQLQPNSNDMDTMNASLFFTFLFTDALLNAQLQIEEKILIGNALSLAVWKEQWETDILLHAETKKAAEKYIMTEYASPLDQEHADDFFDKHCRADRLTEYKEMDSVEGELQIMQLSPWCGFRAVMRMLQAKTTSQRVGQRRKSSLIPIDSLAIDNRNMKKILHGLLQAEEASIVDLFKSITTVEKRKMEHQTRLLKVLGILSELQTHEKKVLKVMHDIKVISHANIMVDSEGSLMLYTQQGMQFIHRLKNNVYFQEEMHHINDAMKDYASSAIADVMSQSGEKLMQKTIHYFVFLPFLIRLARGEGGLFLSMGKWLGNLFRQKRLI